MSAIPPLDRLIVALARLPGVGRRSAERMAMKLVADPGGLRDDLITALQSVKDQVTVCERCGCATAKTQNPCRLCVGPGRDDAVLCVVEDPGDIPLIERSGGFTGRYHALMGRISPMRGEGPADLRLAALYKRIGQEGVKEIILALATDVEGDATAAYICEALKGRNVKVTRLAHGLPSGSAVRYSDPITLARAIKGRQEA